MARVTAFKPTPLRLGPIGIIALIAVVLPRVNATQTISSMTH